jgi:hypothetical protein
MVSQRLQELKPIMPEVGKREPANRETLAGHPKVEDWLYTRKEV